MTASIKTSAFCCNSVFLDVFFVVDDFAVQREWDTIERVPPPRPNSPV